jgi:Family of unknown function (DUF6055)/Bacterial Ig domain
MHKKIHPRHLLPVFAVSLSLSCAVFDAQAQTCVSGTWQSPPNSDFDPINGAFPVQAESARFQIRWPADKPNLITRAQLDASLPELERMMNWFTGPSVKWPEPFCDTAVKYKVQIFVNEGYGLSGSGTGARTPTMWVNPYAVIDAGRGLVGGMVHEFTHAMQYSTRGMRNTDLYGGWLWESNAEFMAHQYPGNSDKTGCSSMLAWMPHLYYGSSRDRYCNWQFWDQVKNKYGFPAVNDLFVKTAGQTGQDPLLVLMRNQGWSVSRLGDEFGQFAMRNVNWDYIDPDGFNRGAAYRNAFGPNTDVGTVADYSVSKRLRLARMEAIDVANRRFVVSKFFAPERYGYNIVKLVPDAGATKITVNFRGVVQSQIAQGAEVGWGDFQPGASPDWTSLPMPQNPASNWRWGVVAIDQNGNSRYSALQSGASADLEFALQTSDVGVYLAVTAAPDAFIPIAFDQMYHTRYRYPYKLQLAGAMPDGFQPGYQANLTQQFPAGSKHANGGGWVATGARVDSTAYVGPNAAVLGGQVLGNARIEDYAIVWNGTVQDNAIVGGLTQLNAGMTVAENARVYSIMAGGQSFSGGTIIKGNAILYGDLETHFGTTPVTKGVFSGFMDNSRTSNAKFGANRTTIPVEVTAPIPAGWPSAGGGMVLPPDVVDCAAEGQVCTMPDTRSYTVYFGANGSYKIRTGVLGSVVCDNATFGDPLPGTVKRCYRKAEGSAPPAPSNSTPMVSLTAPANNASYTQGAIISFAATAMDADGSIAKVDLFDNGNLIGTDSAAPFSWTWGSAAVGNHVFTAKAVDNLGATATSVGVNVVVRAPSTTPPSGAIKCAAQNGTCVLPSGKTATVWFGAWSSYKVRVGMSGSVACNANTFGGDPIRFISKSCYYVTN